MKIIDMQSWKRRGKFQMFNAMGSPHFNICANVDITEFKSYLKEREISFFKGVLYLLSKTVNEIPELRTRIRGDQVVEHTCLNTSFTMLMEDETFDFCEVAYREDFWGFIEETEKSMERVRQGDKLDKGSQGDGVFYVTSLPWISFTSVQHAMHIGESDSIPRVAIGKYFWQGERLMMPLAIQMHHALADGIHAGKFYMKIEEYLKTPALHLGGDGSKK